MKSVFLSFIFVLTLITPHFPSSASLPFVVIHGIGQDCRVKKVSELINQLSHWSATDGYCIESSHGKLSSWLLPLKDQAAIACSKVKQMKELNQGYNIIGLSQGNLIARSIIEFCDGAPKTNNFISLAGPHAGIGSPPFSLFRGMHFVAAKLINFGIYRKFTQNIPTYLENSKFLPKLNNEIPNERSSIYKERFKSLENLVLIKFDNEHVLISKETSWFGYYQDHSFRSVLPVRETKLFVEDWIGLKALEEAGKVTCVTLPGDHLAISDDGLKKYIVPFLKNKDLTWHNATTPRVLVLDLKRILLRLKRQCPKDVQVIRR